MSKRVLVSEVTLSQLARLTARRNHVEVSELQVARADTVSIHETPEYVVAIAALRDGRRVRMCCSPALPSHVVKLSVY
jgi:hypothetical protein